MGAQVSVNGGTYEGQAGTITKLTAQQVYVQLDGGSEVRISQASVTVKSAAAAKPTPAAAAPTTPATGGGSRTRRALLVTAESSLAELRSFIDEHDLAVSKAIGGRNRRTKAQMFADVESAWASLPMEVEEEQVEGTRCASRSIDERDVKGKKMTVIFGAYRKRVQLPFAVESAISDLGGIDKVLDGSYGNNRLAGSQVNEFKIDTPSSTGLARLLGLTTRELCIRMGRGEAEIVKEFEEHGTADDKECLEYVLHKAAGSSDKEFYNGKRDLDPARHGWILDDFVNTPQARAAELERDEVLALRLYTTKAYDSINSMLRARGGSGVSGVYPFPATVGFIASGLKKLRENENERGTAQNPVDLFCGMRDLKLLKDTPFMENVGDDADCGCQGGTMTALRSSTTELKIALKVSRSQPPVDPRTLRFLTCALRLRQYAASESALIFKIKTEHFRQRGGDISFLSCFPDEAEVLFPPLTFFKPSGNVEKITLDGKAHFTVVEVVPDID